MLCFFLLFLYVSSFYGTIVFVCDIKNEWMNEYFTGCAVFVCVNWQDLDQQQQFCMERVTECNDAPSSCVSSSSHCRLCQSHWSAGLPDCCSCWRCPPTSVGWMLIRLVLQTHSNRITVLEQRTKHSKPQARPPSYRHPPALLVSILLPFRTTPAFLATEPSSMHWLTTHWCREWRHIIRHYVTSSDIMMTTSSFHITCHAVNVHDPICGNSQAIFKAHENKTLRKVGKL